MSDRRAEVLALEAADRLEEAAELAEVDGAWADATRLWERAVRFDRAARAALAGNDAERALDLATRGGHAEPEAAAIAILVTRPERALGVAAKLSDLGRHASAARLRLAAGDASGAAEAFERAGALFEAARAHAASGDPRRAARCLDSLLETDPDNRAARLELGELLGRHGRHEAAVRVLQRVPQDAPERGRAARVLHASLTALGLAAAARELEAEIAGAAADPPEAVGSDPSASGAQVLFGRYRVVADVARTPTAHVLRAVDQISGGEVAVKLFSAASLRDSGRDALRRFEREATVLGKLRHPAIVPLRDYFPDAPAVVLEWMPGGSLADRLEREALSPAHGVEIARAVLTALGEAHRRGILHRDIKPANVLFDRGGAAYLADFGAAHVADAAATVTSGVLGTLAYMAPEQRRGEPATVKSDLYGVGALFWHILSGAPPGESEEFLSDELSAEARAVARRLIGAPDERPESALGAADLLGSVPFPRKVPERRAARADGPPSRRPHDERLVTLASGELHDRWLDRSILVFPLESSEMPRVRAFARADHRALASVLAVHNDEGNVWVERVSGERVCDLDDAEREALRDALEALARAGSAHGRVDPAHLVRRGGLVVLTYDSAPEGASLEADLAALAQLPARSPTTETH